MRVLVTGSNGLLGQHLTSLLLKQDAVLLATSFGPNRIVEVENCFKSLDISNYQDTLKTINSFKPDLVINTAAATNVDECEHEKEKCDDINHKGVKNLISAFTELKIEPYLIHLSTDFIFDGKKGYYKETDAPNPLSYYGLSKLKSEEVLTNSTIDFTILRTILVYGKVYNMSRNNIVLWVKKMLENQQEITIVDDQYRMPTYVVDLAMACKIAIDKKAIGIFNIASNTLLSVYQIAQEIANCFGLNKDFIKPISTATLNQTAPRPAKTGFDLTKTNSQLGFYPKSFTEDLKRFKEKLIKTTFNS